MTTLHRVVLLSLLLVILAACAGDPAYTPDIATLATREAAEYAARQDKIQVAWTVGMVFVSALLAIVVGLVLFLSRIGYRLQAARARKLEIENERLEFIALGDGRAYHIPTKTIVATDQANRIAAPILPAQQLTPPETVSDSQYLAFLQRAAHVHPDGWHGMTIPGHREIGMSGAHWTACTRPMLDDGLIETSPTGTVVTDGRTLLDLYNLIAANPY